MKLFGSWSFPDWSSTEGSDRQKGEARHDRSKYQHVEHAETCERQFVIEQEHDDCHQSKGNGKQQILPCKQGADRLLPYLLSIVCETWTLKTLCHCFIVGSVHDELIIECSPEVSLQAVCDQMGRTPPWIPGLLLRADGYECEFYMKD